jgi:hypothetical protein
MDAAAQVAKLEAELEQARANLRYLRKENYANRRNLV